LDTAYRSVVEEIQRLEHQIRHLRARLQILDDARVLVTEQLTTSEEAKVRSAAMEHVDERSGRLQDEVLRTLRLMCRQSDEDFSAARIAAAMRSNDHPNSDSRAFYASVYTTLMRLCNKQFVLPVNTAAVRRFRDATNTTKLLFPSPRPSAANPASKKSPDPA